MPTTARTPIARAVVTLCALVTVVLGPSAGIAVAAQQPTATPTTTAPAAPAVTCPNQITPPPAVDTSEQPAPGSTAPTPVPVPATPVGGPQLGQCGVILPAGAPAAPTDIGYDSWVIQDLDTGAVLAAKAPHARERPASLIKLLLAIVVTKNLDPTTVVDGTQADADQEGSRVGIGPGGQYTVDQLLHGLMMNSGNDVAHALAMRMGGMQATVTKMNALAHQLGALDTRTASPSGLDGPGMATSAYDLSVIFKAALNTPEVAACVHTATMPWPGYGSYPGFTISNDNQLLTSYPGDLGGKVGYTDDAQQTYADAATRDGHRIAIVMMHGTNHIQGRWHDARELLDYGFALDAAHTAPVGKIVTAAPAVAGKGSGSAPGGKGGARLTPAAADGAPRVIAPVAAKTVPPPDTTMSEFGTVGLPVTILAAIAVVLIGLLAVRRQAAKRRRNAVNQKRAAEAVAAKRAEQALNPPQPASAAESPSASTVTYGAADQETTRMARPQIPHPQAPQKSPNGTTTGAVANAGDLTQPIPRINGVPTPPPVQSPAPKASPQTPQQPQPNSPPQQSPGERPARPAARPVRRAPRQPPRNT